MARQTGGPFSRVDAAALMRLFNYRGDDKQATPNQKFGPRLPLDSLGKASEPGVTRQEFVWEN